jgi:hypothetical protein
MVAFIMDPIGETHQACELDSGAYVVAKASTERIGDFME